ncbi:VOC family protein [Nocardia sp. CA2R105]|uniref:VOC family protein n=1 Tax=Nocardia coffeae TaxID=2873381 RepID=UPI001CA632E2|nr:VOC family protein [Nocardia coffeae]MBY8862567.1 VOC family protein [Nocardia coffeae]
MTETTSEISARVATPVWPCLTYRDAPAAIEFLCRAFGFVERARYGEGDVVQHAELGGPGGGGIMLGSVREDSVHSELPTASGSVYVVVDNPDELFTRAERAGAIIMRGLRDEDYGSRGFTCRDPEGVIWSFGTYAGAPGGE